MSAQLFADDILFLQRLLKAQGLYAGDLDGVWGSKTEAGQNAFETQSAEIAAALGTFDLRSERNIATLLLKTQRAARTAMKALGSGALGEGVTVRVLSGTRTYAEQNALYKQGRFGNPGSTVTNARGGQSNHNFGIAWDIGIFDKGAYLTDSPLYKQAGTIVLAATLGVEWGGNWVTIVDEPHYQLVTGMKISEVRTRFEAGEPFVPQ
jgi:peptidoglycan L-alanyl-D-glutamate endopeptidase CwlK